MMGDGMSDTPAADQAPVQVPFAALGTTALPPAPPLGTSGAAWLADLLAGARAASGTLPPPTLRDEAWRFTDIGQIARQSYVVAAVAPVAPLEPLEPGDRAAPSAAVDGAALESLLIDEARGARLVYVDGIFDPSLSSVRAVPAGVWLAPLSHLSAAGGAAAERLLPAVRSHMARHAGFQHDFFSAMNTARLSDAAVVLCERGVAASTPVHLLFVTTERPSPIALQPRVLVMAEAGSELTVIEEYASLGESIAFTNAVAEIVVEANGSVHHVRLQRENRASFHVGRCAASLARDARYRSVSVNIGARLSRLDLGVTLDGEGAQAQLDGLALLDARQHSDTHTLLDHARPDGNSRQLHKCVCDGGSHAVFNGRILVRPDAQRTDSAQQSRGLLLSPKAQINAKPQLEIFADDVKAAHGATVGQLDGDELFYLASRGLPPEQARKLLTYAFAAEVIERIAVRSLVSRLAAQVMARTGLQ